MGPIKSLWAAVQGDPVFMRRVNGWLTDLLDRHDPRLARYRLGQERRVRLRALALGARLGPLVGLASSSGEVNQAAEMEAHAKEDLAGDVVEQVIEKTDVERAPSP